MRKTSLLTIALILLTASMTLAQKKYAAAQAGKHVGQYATVVGKIYQVYQSRRGTIFFDIGGRYPNNTFAGVIFAKEAGNFKKVDQYKGKTVEITGKIQTYQGTAEIILSKPGQLKVEK